MGRIFLEQMSGSKLYDCRECSTNITCIEELLSTDYSGRTGRAFLFSNVVNVVLGEIEKPNFFTGFYLTRSVNCKKCLNTLGWFYEYAHRESERYKEGKTVLEASTLNEVDGLSSETWDFFDEEIRL